MYRRKARSSDHDEKRRCLQLLHSSPCARADGGVRVFTDETACGYMYERELQSLRVAFTYIIHPQTPTIVSTRVEGHASLEEAQPPAEPSRNPCTSIASSTPARAAKRRTRNGGCS